MEASTSSEEAPVICSGVCRSRDWLGTDMLGASLSIGELLDAVGERVHREVTRMSKPGATVKESVISSSTAART